MIRTNRARAYKYLNKKNKIIGILSISEMFLFFILPLMFTSTALSGSGKSTSAALFVLVFLFQSFLYFLIYQLIVKNFYFIFMFLREKVGLSKSYFKNWRSHE